MLFGFKLVYEIRLTIVLCGFFLGKNLNFLKESDLQQALDILENSDIDFSSDDDLDDSCWKPGDFNEESSSEESCEGGTNIFCFILYFFHHLTSSIF